MSINATKTLKIIAERASPQNKSHERISKKQSKPITKQLSINWDEKVEKLKSVAEKLDKLVVKFELKAGEEDKLFGSVTTQMISEGLLDQGFNVERKDIIIADPIKALGNYYVDIYLHKDVSCKVKIKVKALEE